METPFSPNDGSLIPPIFAIVGSDLSALLTALLTKYLPAPLQIMQGVAETTFHHLHYLRLMIHSSYTADRIDGGGVPETRRDSQVRISAESLSPIAISPLLNELHASTPSKVVTSYFTIGKPVVM